MIKCPNCGSTAQVKIEFEPHISRDKAVLTEGYSCGCGCHFSVEYKRNDVGNWEHYWTSCDYIEAI